MLTSWTRAETDDQRLALLPLLGDAGVLAVQSVEERGMVREACWATKMLFHVKRPGYLVDQADASDQFPLAETWPPKLTSHFHQTEFMCPGPQILRSRAR